MRRDLFWAAAILLTGSVLSAQVPVGQGVRFSSNSAVGHEIIDPATGITIPVTGLSAQDAFTSCGTIDPVTGELWTSGEGFSRGRVVRVSLSGAVGSASLVVDTGDDTHSAMDFDWNGDVYLCSAGEVVKVEPRHGAAHVLGHQQLPRPVQRPCASTWPRTRCTWGPSTTVRVRS